MSPLRGMVAAAAAKLRSAAALRTSGRPTPGRVVRGRTLCDGKRADSEGLGKQADVKMDVKTENASEGLRKQADAKMDVKTENTSEVVGKKAEVKMNVKTENTPEVVGKKPMTEYEMRYLLLEKEVTTLKCVVDFQAKVNWYSLGLVATIVASIPLGLSRVSGMEERQKEWETKWEKKHKLLKSRILQIEHQPIKGEEEEEPAKGEGEEAKGEGEEKEDIQKTWLQTLKALLWKGE